MEKPFTLDVASAERALDAAARAGIVLAVAYPRRFHPSVAELKGRIADGRLGVLSHCQSEQTAPAGLSMRADYWRSDPVEVPAGAMTATGDDAVAIARTAGFRMLVMSPHPSCGDCPLTASEPAKKSGQISRKIVVGQQKLSGWWKTLAELPFIGDQVVCLGQKRQPAAKVAP